MNISTDVFNNTFQSVTKTRPLEIVFNQRNTVDVDEIVENADKLQWAVKVEQEKKKVAYEKQHDDK